MLKMEKNKCLLYMYTNQIANCKKGIENLKKNFPLADANATSLLEAAIFLRDKHADQATSHLETMLSTGVRSNEVTLTLAQLYLSKGKLEETIKVLEHVTDIKYMPAVVGLSVSLCNILGKRDLAIKCLDNAIKYGQENPSKLKKEHIVTYMRESSNLKLANGDIESGVKMLETLRAEDSSDMLTLAKIISAYSQINLQKALQYSKDLPELSKGSQDVNLDMIEMTDMIGSFRFSKKALKQSFEEGEVKAEVGLKRKRRKRKKGKLPKNYNPEVDPDPERWLPRWERSTFKPKRQKRGTSTVGKGTQGAVGGADQPASPKPNSVSSPKAGSSTTSPKSGASNPTTPNVVPPRQQKPGSKAKSKKNKKGGGW